MVYYIIYSININLFVCKYIFIFICIFIYHIFCVFILILYIIYLYILYYIFNFLCQEQVGSSDPINKDNSFLAGLL